MKKVLLITYLLFFTFVLIGLFLASKKTIWTDELFTQFHLEHTSFSDIFTGNIKDEGNPCPLFYLIQKTHLLIQGFTFPMPTQNEVSIYEPYSQIILRIPSVIFMSLALSIVFFVFSRFYSIKLGLMSLLLMLSNPIVWLYWAEARPYSLWLLLSVVQLSIFLKIVLNNQRHDWLFLALCHVLLSITIVFSLPQILIISACAWFYEKDKLFKQALISFLPIILISFFYTQTKKTYGWIPSDITKHCLDTTLMMFTHVQTTLSNFNSLIITLNIPFDWMKLLILINILMLCLIFIPKLKFRKELTTFNICTLLLLICSLNIITIFKNWNIAGITHYQPYERYFIPLFPFALFTVTLFVINTSNFTKDLLSKLILNTMLYGSIINSSLFTFLYISSLSFYG